MPYEHKIFNSFFVECNVRMPCSQQTLRSSLSAAISEWLKNNLTQKFNNDILK